MASRAIFRRKSSVLSHLNESSIRSFWSFQHGQLAPGVDSVASNLMADCHLLSNDRRTQGNVVSSSGEKLPTSLSLGFLHHNYSRVWKSSWGDGRVDFVSSSSVMRLMLHSVRHGSTATARQPDFSDEDDGNERQASEKKMEASPEECDQAVEGLSSTIAKAKARKLEESGKMVKSAVERLWAMFLAIGPAFRAVALMSREDWAKKLHHWKDEFKSTMQHYWLGTKLLWADVRISSRLLLKLAGGRSLSRRERRQLTRTTADIFRKH